MLFRHAAVAGMLALLAHGAAALSTAGCDNACLERASYTGGTARR